MPSNKLHKAMILYHRPAGRGYYRLVLQSSALASQVRPGQFVMLRVSENMDPLLARPFGIASVIAKKSIELYYRVAGRGTSLLTTAQPGRTLAVLGPLGNCFPVPGKDLVPVLVAGGSGFPPLLYFISAIRSQSCFFFGARTKDCLPPAGVVKSFRKWTKRVYSATEDGSAGKKGLVTDLLSRFLESSMDKERIAIYACGPRPMLATVARIAADHSIRCYVSMEERMACGLGACMGCSVGVKAGGYKRVCKEGPVFDAREIDWRESKVFRVESLKS